MALKQIQVCITNDTHAHLKDLADSKNKAMGNVVDVALTEANPVAIGTAITNRAGTKTVLEPATKKTLYLVSQKALDNLSSLSEGTGASKGFLTRLIIEHHLQKVLESQPQHD